jgi:hypothetical protein
VVSIQLQGKTASFILQALIVLFNNHRNFFAGKEVEMILSKAGKFKTVRFLGVLCAIVMGFLTLVATSEDDAKDIIDIDFNANATFDLEPVTVDRAAVTSIQAAGDDCDTLTINEALAAVEDDIEDLDEVDIDDVELQYVEGTYTATWLPEEVTSFSCSLTITGTNSTTIAQTAINGSGGSLDDTLTQEQRDVINYYLTNRGEEFTYCVVCDDTEITSYSVTYNVSIGVEIEGTI